MKKGKTLLFIIILLLSLLYLLVKYVNLSTKYSLQQERIDREFKSSLSHAMSGFAVDLNSSSHKESALYMYNEAMSNLAIATKISYLTTYESKNDSLDVALNSLYRLMEQDKYKKSIIEKSITLHDNLSELSLEPTNKEVTANIIKITEDITQEIDN